MAPMPAHADPPAQTLPEALDSLSDNALNTDRSQIYRVDGKRRYVRLGRGWTAALDEQPAARLESSGASPGTAGPPGRTIEFVRAVEATRFRIYTQRDSTGHESGLSGAWDLAPGWLLRAQSFRLRDSDTHIARNDSEAALRHGTSDLWIEAIVRRAGLQDTQAHETWTDRAPAATFAGVRSQWQAWPKLSFFAQTQHAVRADMAPGDEALAEPRTEFGADYRPGGALEGVHLYWREATQLGLLSSQGLDRRSTYRRVFGGDVSDGSRDGRVYLQLRRHSLLDERDALLVTGWRHTLEPAPQWELQTFIESAQPLSGPSAVRSLTLGLRLTQSAHPSHSLVMETETVNSSLKDSAYAAVKYTERFTTNSLMAWRASVSEKRPREPDAVAVGDFKGSVGWAWREPEQRDIVTLWRYTLQARNAQGPDVQTPGVADRRAHILFGGLDWQATPVHHASLRGSRRWDRDESFREADLHTTTLWVLRGTLDLSDRWLVSAHAAARSDSAFASERGLGAEIGFKLSRKVALALGYNPRGAADDDLALDDRLGKGVTLRLRFLIENAAARWLDPPMPERD